MAVSNLLRIGVKNLAGRPPCQPMSVLPADITRDRIYVPEEVRHFVAPDCMRFVSCWQHQIESGAVHESIQPPRSPGRTGLDPSP